MWREPLAVLVMCRLIPVDHSFVLGRQFIAHGEFTQLDVAELLCRHGGAMRRLYGAVS